MDPSGQQMEDKLNKSLEDLIKEQQQATRSAGKGGARGSERGAGRGSARTGRGGGGRRSKQREDDAMDTEEASGRPGRRVDTSVLKARGGVGKTQGKGRGVRGSNDGPPRGNINRSWTHDQFEDDGPDRPRKVAGGAHRQQTQRPVANMSVVRISNLPGQVTSEDMIELLSLVDQPMSIKLAHADDGTRICEAHMRSEEVARAVQERYTECALDGQALRVQLAGTRAHTMLSSGLTVEKVRSAPGGGPAALRGSGAILDGGGSARPRGRGAQKGRGARMHGY